MAIAQHKRLRRGNSAWLVVLLFFGLVVDAGCGGCDCSYDTSTGQPLSVEYLDAEVLEVDSGRTVVRALVVAVTDSDDVQVGDEVEIWVGRSGVRQLEQGVTYRFPVNRDVDRLVAPMTSGCCPRAVITDLEGREVYESALSSAWGQARTIGIAVIVVLVLIVPLTVAATGLSRALGRDFDS